jgi:UDP-glucuronate decarboxylase
MLANEGGSPPKQRKPEISSAMNKLGWTPKIALRERLLKTIAYFEQGIARA